MATTFVERLEGSYRESICSFLSKAGEAAPYIAPYAMWAGGYGKAISIGLGVATMAARTQCGWDPNQPSEIGGSGESQIAAGQCLEATGSNIAIVDAQGSIYVSPVKKLVAAVPNGTYPNGTPKMTVTYQNSDGVMVVDDESMTRAPLTTRILNGATCVGDVSPEPAPTPPTIPPHTYTDPESGCTLIVETLGFGEGIDGNINPIVQISPGPETRDNSGGRIGGCNFEPVIYYNENEGGCCPPIPPIPVPPNPPDGPNGEPWWLDLLKKAGATAAGNLAAAAIRSFFEPVLPIASFTLVAPCDKDEEENPLEMKYALPIQNYQSRVLSQQAVIMEILQQHLNWKTPICFPKNESGRYFRSIAFESETYSPNSNSRLVKRFRYRSNSPGDVRQLATHWAVFKWNTGPVIVWHTGSALGAPKVWAASVDEGKRVIRHAGGEAGIDPDQVGEWGVGSSDNARYGVSTTVKLKCVDGTWAATARQGPDGWPEAAG